jgi:hypothetical protein
MAIVKDLQEILKRKPELRERLPLSGNTESNDLGMEQVAPWPDDLAEEAYHGLAGEVVRAIDPYSEADPAALLTNFLVAFGNIIGHGPYFMAGADKHYLNLYAALVGESAKGRKGMSWSWIRELFKIIDKDWALFKTPGGLSTGEGLIWQVRDPITVRQPVKEKGRVVDYEEVEIDPGVSDKRLLVIEAEFASALKVMARQGNTLSPLIRRAWDTGDLASMTKNSPARATGAHISIIGHITRTELIQALTQTEQANGFANRFLWVCVRRSKYLPDGDPMPQQELNRLAARVNEAVQFAKTVGELKRDPEAAEIWRLAYPALSEGKPGLLGAVVGRAEAQVMRLACIYALLDKSHLVRPEHLGAALAFWRRCEQSVRFIFGGSEGDPVADTILEALEKGPMTQTEISDLFNRNLSANVLKEALQRLSAAGKVVATQQKTGKRPVTVWSLKKP